HSFLEASLRPTLYPPALHAARPISAPHQGGQQRRTQGQRPYSAPSHSSSPPSSTMRGNRAVNRAPTPSGPRWAMISPPWRRAVRSEEHTSELQSRFVIVCRLLLYTR